MLKRPGRIDDEPRLKARKLANIARTNPDVIAAGNIGCMTQIASGRATPVVPGNVRG